MLQKSALFDKYLHPPPPPPPNVLFIVVHTFIIYCDGGCPGRNVRGGGGDIHGKLPGKNSLDPFT